MNRFKPDPAFIGLNQYLATIDRREMEVEEIERLEAEVSQLTNVLYELRQVNNQIMRRLQDEATQRYSEVQNGAQNDLRTREWR